MADKAVFMMCVCVLVSLFKLTVLVFVCDCSGFSQIECRQHSRDVSWKPCLFATCLKIFVNHPETLGHIFTFFFK